MQTWPSLNYTDWADTAETLHMWTQIVGKIRMEKTPPVNHWWHVPLYVTARGLGTSAIPHERGMFEIDFDFVDHRLQIATSDGERGEFKLRPMTVAEFHRRVLALLDELKLDVSFSSMPQEVADPIPFESDTKHHSYDAEAVERFWRALVLSSEVLARFRSDFLGKVSPIHFFWGAIDLAVTRFSGRLAPPHPGAPGLPLRVAREAYSHEVCSAGFWPGGNGFEAAYYSYAYPEPEGYATATVKPAKALYNTDLREFILPYETVRSSESPEKALMDFLQSTYDLAADLAKWDRKALERHSTAG